MYTLHRYIISAISIRIRRNYTCIDTHAYEQIIRTNLFPFSRCCFPIPILPDRNACAHYTSEVFN